MQNSIARPHRAAFADHRVGDRTFRVARWPAAHAAHSRPLLFFSGIGANTDLLAPFLERLGGREVITFDMPGIGETPPDGGPYRLSAMANAAAEILTNLGCDTADVMGVSWGGMLAQEFAYRFPQRTGRLVLAATSAGMPMIPGSLSTLVKMLGSHRYADPASILPYLQTLYGGSDEGLATYATRMQSPSSLGYMYQLIAIAGWTGVRKLSHITSPTLILMGDEDRLLPPINGQILKFLIRGAALEILENAGHLFVLTHADWVVETIENFLSAQSAGHPPHAQTGPSEPAHHGALVAAS